MSTVPSTSSSGTPSASNLYHLLRNLFLLGYVLNIVLWFIPTMRVGEQPALSAFSLVRLVSQLGNWGATILLVLVFASNVAFVVLALAYPRRWVFIVASSVASFLILLNLFSASNPEMHNLIIPRVLQWCAEFLTLTGFFIKPPTDLRSQPA